jgi:hypothetical protein
MRAVLFSFAIAIVSVLLWPVVIAAQTSALEGTWRANLAKSTYSPGPAPKSQTVKWERAQGGLLFTVDQVTADGRTTHGETLEKPDGSDAPVRGSQPPITRFFKRIDDRTYEDGNKVNGKLTGNGHDPVPAEGSTLMATCCFTFVSVARYTCPMPPSPRSAVIS